MVVNVNSNEENYNPGKLNIIVTSREKGSFTDILNLTYVFSKRIRNVRKIYHVFYTFTFRLSVKVTFKHTIKSNDYWIFVIFFVFTLVFSLERETRERWIVQRVYLHIWTVAGHKLGAIGSCDQGFNLLLIPKFLN